MTWYRHKHSIRAGALSRWGIAAMVSAAVAAGCDYPFQPMQENTEAFFSMFGYLDLKADTQWIRVMPVRESLLLDDGPIDAVVTLEHMGSGRTVTLRDSLFRFTDQQLGGVAYAHNFWTAEPLEPGATYRLSAVRSDGAATTATVVMPADLEIAFLTGPGIGTDNALLRIRAEHVLFVKVRYAMLSRSGHPAAPVTLREQGDFSTREPGTHTVAISPTVQTDSLAIDVFRREILVAVARADWPFDAELSDVAVALPGTMPSNVEHGFGFVGGVAMWTIPLASCAVLEPRPSGDPYCLASLSERSASIAGRVVGACGDPHAMSPVRLTERFAGGGAVTRTWKTGWDGRYHFEGIEAGAALTLEFGPGTAPVPLPPLTAGQRLFVADQTVAAAC